MSGTEIIEEIEKQTGSWKPSPGSIYPLLAWLQKKGFTEELPKDESGFKRYYFTEEGKKFLEQQINLLKRHAEILEALSKSDRPLGIIKLSKITGHSPHLVRYSLRELENADVIRPSARGANRNPQAKTFLNNLNKEINSLQGNLDDFAARLKTISKSR